ncbi:MFS transporter [Kitasatospora sp. NBC_01287]|uniref:MFS transporter n=1 Tax=Kitasatospora sp. NBC_01287 TaxID=2903573 RepID=UPI002255DDC3|nr:MFS transporter [Kitasatospora sp. NBC_01287]MCX4748954.1 MFS transporter [Kitasatospora sp. NBC_01287]
MFSRAREAGRSAAHHAPTLSAAGAPTTPASTAPGLAAAGPATADSATVSVTASSIPADGATTAGRPGDEGRTSTATPLVPLAALFTIGYLPAYLVPTITVRLTGDFGLTGTQAGGIGSALLLASAAAGIALAGRVASIGPARLARAGLAVLTCGFTLAAATPGGSVPLLVVGCLLGGLGAGTASAVAGTGVAAAADPHRASVLGLLTTSTVAAGLYLVLPRLGSSHAAPFLALAALGLLARPLLASLPGTVPPAGTPPLTSPPPLTQAPPPPVTPNARHRLPHRTAGLLLAVTTVLWAIAQNALWGVSGQIGLHRVGFTERALGLVFAVALAGGLLGVLASGALGSRIGRVLPLGLGTAAIAACVALSAAARSAVGFAGGEVLWNVLYPLVLTYLIGLAAELDPAGRWTVLVGSASALGVAGGPLTGATLLTDLGCPLLAAVLGGTLLLTAGPLVLLARAFGASSPGPPGPSAPPIPLPTPRAPVPPVPDPTAAEAA